jgi:hypothetical protein
MRALTRLQWLGNTLVHLDHPRDYPGPNPGPPLDQKATGATVNFPSSEPVFKKGAPILYWSGSAPIFGFIDDLNCGHSTNGTRWQPLMKSIEPEGSLCPGAYLSGLRRPTEIVNQDMDADQ